MYSYIRDTSQWFFSLDWRTASANTWAWGCEVPGTTAIGGLEEPGNIDQEGSGHVCNSTSELSWLS